MPHLHSANNVEPVKHLS